MKTINYIGIFMGLILLSVSGVSATLYDDFNTGSGCLDTDNWYTHCQYGYCCDVNSNSYSRVVNNEAVVHADAEYTLMRSKTLFNEGTKFKFRWYSSAHGSDSNVDIAYFSIGTGYSDTGATPSTGYYIYLSTDGNFIRLYKIVTGTATLIDSGSNPFTRETNYDIDFNIYTDDVYVKVDGETILESTDTISGFGSGYFEVYSPYTGSGPINYIDDVYGGSGGFPPNDLTISLQDNCANPLVNATTVVYNKDDSMNVVYEGTDNPITIPSYQVNENDELMVVWSTWRSLISKTCYAQFDHDINLFDPIVYWVIDVDVYDNETNPIDYANVDFNQDCTIFGYATRNKYTDTDGLAEFYQCENKNAILTVSKNGYQTLSETISGGWYDVHQNTYEISVILQPSEDTGNNSNSTVYNDTVNDTNATEIPEDIPNADGIPESIQLYFRDVDGAYTTEVKDTDDYVNCYYSVKSSDPLYMTLKFQESPNGWDWFDVHTYGYYIDNNSYGYMHLPNSYFNDSTLTYRAYIYDEDYFFSDRYAYLSVVNETNDSETHYENLTGMCMFMHRQLNNTIDYREDIVCYTYVDANTNALKTVSLELYKEDTLIDYKNLTYNDLDADSMYGWYLGYTYEANNNYSLVLKASDGSILDTDNIRAINNVGNKLTIKVTDFFNHPLNHVYVFCEHYGSINTGYLSYGTFEGLPDGESRYKASKSGYRSGIWSTVNLTSENEIVTYQLIQEIQEGSVSAVRMSDDSVKDLYYPFMYFLMIIILIGGLLHVVK